MSDTRVFNFNAGPSTLPLPVLERTQKEFLNYEGSGMSIIEHSHRGKVYEGVHNECIALFKELLELPDTHEVLFMQGGASAQFALVPMNLRKDDHAGDYIVTGTWSKKALKEAKAMGKPNVAWQPEDGTFVRVPKQSELALSAGAPYVHLTTNNTIAGTQFHQLPETNGVPLVIDTSSDILWRPMDFSNVGVMYAGAQKNLGPSGITIVVIRKDVLESARTDLPSIFQYKVVAENNSLQNTIPTFPVYMVRNVLQWVKEQGGAKAMEKRNTQKAAALYEAIDSSGGFYNCPVEKESRSVMNVVFRLPSEEQEAKFVSEATKAGLVGLKGHRSVGGIRASIYNAMTQEGVQALIDFMNKFKS